jgi:hypothetical protein
LAILEKDWYSGTILAEIIAKSMEVGKAALSDAEARAEAYLYICSQLKAIRQDLLVQHIVTEFTVRAFELHGRVALECADLNEFNQCQTQLKQLYKTCPSNNHCEFLAYRLLYVLYLRGNQQYKAGSSDLIFLLQHLTSAEISHPAVCHALDTRKALQQGNLPLFFRLYQSTPNMGKCIMSMMLGQQRLKFLQWAMKAYSVSNVPALYLMETLAFNSLVEGFHFLQSVGCVFLVDGQPDAEAEAVVAATARGPEIVQVSCKSSEIVMGTDTDALL